MDEDQDVGEQTQFAVGRLESGLWVRCLVHLNDYKTGDEATQSDEVGSTMKICAADLLSLGRCRLEEEDGLDHEHKCGRVDELCAWSA